MGRWGSSKCHRFVSGGGPSRPIVSLFLGSVAVVKRGGPLGAADESGEDARQHLRDDWWCGQADQGPILWRLLGRLRTEVRTFTSFK